MRTRSTTGLSGMTRISMTGVVDARMLARTLGEILPRVFHVAVWSAWTARTVEAGMMFKSLARHRRSLLCCMLLLFLI